jgi:hypothetical protein
MMGNPGDGYRKFLHAMEMIPEIIMSFMRLKCPIEGSSFKYAIIILRTPKKLFSANHPMEAGPGPSPEVLVYGACPPICWVLQMAES